MREEALLSVEGVSAGYGRLAVIRDVSFTLLPGERVAIVGPNGAGKTTTLRAVMGEIPLMAGHVRFAGEEIAALSTAARVQRGLGYCPAGRRLFPELTVRDHLELGARRAPAAERVRRLAGVLAVFPRLAPLLGRRAGLLSGGEQQMVAIGRALMGAPRLLLLDEPSTGLAPRVVHDLYTALHGLAAQRLAVLIVEQNVRAALRFAMRGFLMSGGTLTAPLAGPVGDRPDFDAFLGLKRELS
jgi:branched-chain amino acid transport system ATP-binding protein